MRKLFEKIVILQNRFLRPCLNRLRQGREARKKQVVMRSLQVNNMKEKAPWWLNHKPIITVDYSNKDAEAGDAKFLSIGRSQWSSEDFSAKIFRHTGNRWSPQSEEMPLWRVLDIATLLVAVINNKQSNLNEFVQDPESVDELRDYIRENMEILVPKMQELTNMLGGGHYLEQSKDLPNIFSFATSELSQDAMFAWIIQWANPNYREKDKSLFDTAQSFVKLLLGSNDFKIKSIEVGRQWQNIDIWSEINDNTFLIIEDKTNTSIHDDQLDRYKEIVQKEYKGKRENLQFVYIKTGNEPLSTLKEIEGKGYRTISRLNIINCLKQYTGNNFLLLNYIEHLESIEKETQSFRNLPVSQWGWYAWQGFYKELELKLDISSWDYVANPAGGFLGAWWYFTPIPQGNMYLQFEEEKLCFKIYYEGKRERSEVRNEQHDKLLKVAKLTNHSEISKPKRFGAGQYMTIAVVDPDYLFGKKEVDIDKVVEKLKEYQKLIEECCKK